MKRRLRAAAFGVAMISVVALCAGGDRIDATEAAWTRDQHGSASISAVALPTPLITGCTPSTNVLGVFTGVTIIWTSNAPPATTSQAVYFGSTLGTATPSQSGPVGGVYTYSVTYTSSLLTSLIGSLLGSSTPISVRVRSGTNWTSIAATRTLSVALLGLNPQCT